MLGRAGGACSAGGGIIRSQGRFREAASSSLSVQMKKRRSRRRSACGVAAQKGVKHGQLHALLVPPAPRHHRALAVGRVEVVAVARVRQADRRQRLVRKSSGTEKQHLESGSIPDDGFTGLCKGDLSDWF